MVPHSPVPGLAHGSIWPHSVEFIEGMVFRSILANLTPLFSCGCCPHKVQICRQALVALLSRSHIPAACRGLAQIKLAYFLQICLNAQLLGKVATMAVLENVSA